MITTYAMRKELAQEAFGNLGTAEIVELWNEYCESPEGNIDDCVFNMENFDDHMYDLKPSDIARRIHFGEFSPVDDYFYYDGYANLRSGNFANYLLDRWGTDLPIYPEEMIEWYIATKE